MQVPDSSVLDNQDKLLTASSSNGALGTQPEKYYLTLFPQALSPPRNSQSRS